MKYPRLIVHVGFPKCGSSSIQSALTSHYKDLEKQGIRVVGADNLVRFTNSIGRYLNTNDPLIADNLFYQIQMEIAEVWEAAIRNGDRAVLISSEHIVFHMSKSVGLLPKGIKIEAVAVVRNLDQWLQSTFLQSLKTLEPTAPVSYNEFLVEAFKDDRINHAKYLSTIENHEVVSSVSILRLNGPLGESLLDDFFARVLKVDFVPNRNIVENQAISIDQAVILRTIGLMKNQTLTNIRNSKSAFLRLAELVADQVGEYSMRSVLQNDFSEQISKENLDFKTWLAINQGVVIDDDSFISNPKLNLDAIDHVSRRGLRLLIRSFVRLWIESLDSDQIREYDLNFTTEVVFMNSRKFIDSEIIWNSIKDDFREVQELLMLLSNRKSFEVHEDSFRKSPSTRMLEILESERNPDFGFLTPIQQHSEYQETRISVKSLEIFLLIGIQVAWEIFNAPEREWIVDISQNEFILAQSIDAYLGF
jgi:hypothetical protein